MKSGASRAEGRGEKECHGDWFRWGSSCPKRITTEQAGYRRDQSEYLELDVSKSKEGKYDLAVTVTDQVSQKSVTKRVSFWITKVK